MVEIRRWEGMTMVLRADKDKEKDKDKDEH